MSGSANKIPNSDIIGYEGPVGHEKAIHKTRWTATGRQWKSKEDANWVQVGVGKYILLPKKPEERGREAED